MPKQTKFRKCHKLKSKGKAQKGCSLSFGSIALISTSYGRLLSNHIEAARIVISREIKKSGKLWIRIYPDRPLTKKPAEIRMGKGKGPVTGWYAMIKPGRVLYEIDGVDTLKARSIFKLAQAKLPVLTKIIIHEDCYYEKN